MKLTKDFYKTGEAQQILQVTQRSIYNYITSGKLKAVKVGGIYHISKQELERFLKGGK